MDLLSLIGLALLDSLSLGTLVIPVALAIRQQRVEFRPQALYFLTVCSAYFTLGIVLLLGMDTLLEALTDILRTPPALWARLIIGIGLAAFGIFAKNPKKRTPEEIADQPAPKSLSPWAVIALGLSAAAAEAATMVPYLAAIGIMGNMGQPWPVRLAILAGYCFIMIAPALIILTAIAIFGPRIFPRVRRLLATFEYEAKVTLLWIAAIIGVQWTITAAVQIFSD